MSLSLYENKSRIVYIAICTIMCHWATFVSGAGVFMKEIQLTNGFVSHVSDHRFEYLTKHNWRAVKSKKTYYAVTKINAKHVRMHRLIMGVTDQNILIDHEDRNGLNNQDENLRIATNSQNCMNRGLRKDNTSGYKGVAWHKNVKKWTVCVTKNGKQNYIGQFDSKEEAVLAYNEAAIKIHGEFASINNINKNQNV